MNEQYFRQDNTEGFNEVKLKKMNMEVEEEVKRRKIDPNDHEFLNEIQGITERVFNKHC